MNGFYDESIILDAVFNGNDVFDSPMSGGDEVIPAEPVAVPRNMFAEMSDGSQEMAAEPGYIDGIMPTATVTKSGTVSTLTVTDKNGTTQTEIHDGEQGPAGPPGTTTWEGITDKPATFPPESHNHSEYVTLATEQTITSKKKFKVTEPYPPSYVGGQETILKILSAHSNAEMAGYSMWAGRLVVGNKNKTFLMGVYNPYLITGANNPVCGIGAHSWSDAETDANAAWEDMYLNPDGNKACYIGGHQWRAAGGWLKVQNNGAGSVGDRVFINRGTASAPVWKVAAAINDNSTDASDTWSANKLNSVIGDIDTILTRLISGGGV